MQTRSGFCYPRPNTDDRRRKRSPTPPCAGGDLFNSLPDDLVICILTKLSPIACRPSDLIGIFMTCKRLNRLSNNPVILLNTSTGGLAVRAKNWCERALWFLKHCSDAGNLEASYILGMIKFYCLQVQGRGTGLALMAKAAMGSHTTAMYSLAVIKFNGSGSGSSASKDLRAGVTLCARSAFLGHTDALRELGHCLQDGYGIKKNLAKGEKFLCQANAQELTRSGAEIHPANLFLVEWFEMHGVVSECDGLRVCSNSRCGRVETRKHEFRRCSVCGKVNYCSRACQALDWKLAHNVECTPSCCSSHISRHYSL